MPNSTSAPVPTSESSQAQKSWSRQVLGQVPTGVTIITSVDAAGDPVGMIVGTFTSVSENPPLIGFLPQLESTTFAHIERAGRFRASVLGAGHEPLCRQFFSASADDRFNNDQWDYDEHGVPRLIDAVAWFDATVYGTLPAGDHAVVLGAVEAMGRGPSSGGMPLVFLNGGYGSFTVPRMEFNLDDFGGRLRLATSLGDIVADLSNKLGIECALSTVVREEVVVLSAANIRSPRIGRSFPFAAPMAPGFSAWGNPQRRKTWIENARHLLGTVDANLAEDTLELVRDTGYSLSFGETMSEHFDSVVAASHGDRTVLAQLWERVAEEYRTHYRDPRSGSHVTGIQAPVFGHDGTAELELIVGDFGSPVGLDHYRQILFEMLQVSEKLTQQIGGITPSDYDPRIP